jgi:hypothetical protein
MADPSVAAIMDGTAGRICVKDHATDIFGVTRRRLGDGSRMRRSRGSLWVHQEIAQFYGFSCKDGNLGVPHRLRGHCEE